MRSNCADQAVSGYGSSLSSMSRIARPSWIEIVLNAEQLERIRAVAVGEVGLQRAQAEICRVMYHDIGDDGEQRNAQAEQQRGRGRSSFRRSARAHYHAGFGRPFQSQKM